MSRQNISRAAILVLAGIGVVVALVLNGRPDNRLVNTFTSAAFNFMYPDNWDYVIPEYNVLLLGKPETLGKQQPGPTLTVHRNLALSGTGSLEDAFNTYLAQGPLSPGQAWKQLGDMTKTTISGRPALALDLQGSENPGWPEIHSHIAAVSSQNGNVYFLTISSPINDWDSDRDLLEAILASVTITE